MQGVQEECLSAYRPVSVTRMLGGPKRHGDGRGAQLGFSGGIVVQHVSVFILKEYKLSRYGSFVSQQLPFLTIGTANLLEQLYEYHVNDSLAHNRT